MSIHDVLTREQAIKRIKDLSNIDNINNIDHLLSGESYDYCEASGAIIDELKHIFDIKEEELK